MQVRASRSGCQAHATKRDVKALKVHCVRYGAQRQASELGPTLFNSRSDFARPALQAALPSRSRCVPFRSSSSIISSRASGCPPTVSTSAAATATVVPPARDVQPSATPSAESEQFVWAQNWFPVAVVECLDSSRPHPFTLMVRAGERGTAREQGGVGRGAGDVVAPASQTPPARATARSEAGCHTG